MLIVYPTMILHYAYDANRGRRRQIEQGNEHIIVMDKTLCRASLALLGIKPRHLLASIASVPASSSLQASHTGFSYHWPFTPRSSAVSDSPSLSCLHSPTSRRRSLLPALLLPLLFCVCQTLP